MCFGTTYLRYIRQFNLSMPVLSSMDHVGGSKPARTWPACWLPISTFLDLRSACFLDTHTHNPSIWSHILYGTNTDVENIMWGHPSMGPLDHQKLSSSRVDRLACGSAWLVSSLPGLDWIGLDGTYLVLKNNTNTRSKLQKIDIPLQEEQCMWQMQMQMPSWISSGRAIMSCQVNFNFNLNDTIFCR